MRQKGFGSVDDAPEVDVDDALDVLELGLLDVPVVGDAGIVVDLVYLAEVSDDGVSVGQYRLPLSDIEPVGFHLGAECLRLAGGFGKSVGVDVGERELGALRREVKCEGSADAGSCSGDDGDLVFESVH
jgi:hypothetical protein